MSAAGIGAAASVGSSSGKTGRDLRWGQCAGDGGGLGWDISKGEEERVYRPPTKKIPLSPPPKKSVPVIFNNSRGKRHVKQIRRVQWGRLTYNEAKISGPGILETDTYLTGGAFVADLGALRSASRAGDAATGMEKGITLTEETMTHRGLWFARMF